MTVNHLSQEAFVLLAAGTLAEQDDNHLPQCLQCQAELEGWRRLASGTRTSIEPVEVPPFERIVGPFLPSDGSDVAQTAPATGRAAMVSAQGSGFRRRWTAGRAARVCVLLFATHLRLLLRLVVPVVGVGVVIATAAAVRVPTAYASAVFTATVCLVALASALLVCAPSIEFRIELFVTTPVPPPAVLLARTVLAFGLTLGAASLGSLVIANRVDLSLGAVVGAWLGPSTLAGAVALLIAVWRSPTAAAMIAGGFWVLGTLTVTMRTIPAAPHPQTPDLISAVSRVLSTIWTTSPLTLSLSALLLAVACMIATPASRNRLQSGWRAVGD